MMDFSGGGGGVEALWVWWSARTERKKARRSFVRGLLWLVAVGVVLLGWSLLQVTYDVLTLTGRQPQLLSNQALRRMNNDSLILESYFRLARPAIHPKTRSPGTEHERATPHKYLPEEEEDISASRHKVVLVIVDGLRYDYLWKNPKLRALVTRPDIANDVRVWQLHSLVPTISVPNWAALVTGVPPEINGFLANDARQETDFDSILRSARRFGLGRAMAGVSWLSDMYRSDLELMRGNGAVTQAALREHRLVSPDPIVGEILLDSLDPQSPDYTPYRFFLAHFMSVDDMGHLHGVTLDYNPYNTYQKAITNVTKVLSRLVDLLDNETTLIISSDHGHIDRGGHGGTHPLLKAVPLIVYRRGSAIGRGVPTEYPPAQSDTSDLPEPTLPIGGADAEQTTLRRSRGLDKLVQQGASALAVSRRSLLTDGLAERAHSSLLDVAGTVCGLLGIPTPRQSVGLVVPEVIDELTPDRRRAVYRDLFLQKKALVLELFRALDLNTQPLSAFGADTESSVAVDQCDESPEECYQTLINGLMRAYYNGRQQAFTSRVTRSVLTNLVAGLVVLIGVLCLIQRCSFADPLAVLRLSTCSFLAMMMRHIQSYCCYVYHRIRSLPAEGQHSVLPADPMAPTQAGGGTPEEEPQPDECSLGTVIGSSMRAKSEREEAWVMASSFAVVGGFYLVNITLILIFCEQQGNDWDFTMWNTTADAYRYIELVPLMSVVVFFWLGQVYHFLSILCVLRRLLCADSWEQKVMMVLGAWILSIVPEFVRDRRPSSWSPSDRDVSLASVKRCSSSSPYRAERLVNQYLFAHYTFLAALVGMMIIKALEGVNGVFFLPGVWSVLLLSDQTWDMRFRLIGVELMQAPLLVISVVQLGLLLFSPHFSPSSALFDGLWIRKGSKRLPTAGQIQSEQEEEEEEDGLDKACAQIRQVEEEEEEEEDRMKAGWSVQELEMEAEHESKPDDLQTLFALAKEMDGVESPILFFEAQVLVPTRGE